MKTNKRPAHKWTCSGQINVVQNSTVFNKMVKEYSDRHVLSQSINKLIFLRQW